MALALATPAVRAPALLPLFLVSAAAVGYEIALTRYFAVATWSEYGYWVISIVMVGFALSGVAMALAREAAVRHAEALRAWLPACLVAAAALGFHLVALNPFNPLQLQNPVTAVPQLGNIALYYVCLLPFFFLAGLYVSLSFVIDAERIGRVYGADLTGAGAGAAATLALMWLVPPFRLVAALLPLLALACLPRPGAGAHPARHRRGARPATLAALLLGEALLLGASPAHVSDYKAIYAPAHVQGSAVLATRLSPRGEYTLLDDFTERVDTDVSNDAAALGVPGPPRALGLYRDGNRLAALPLPAVAPSQAPPGAPADASAPVPAPADATVAVLAGDAAVAYAPATLGALPYALLSRPSVLLVGASGGFRVREARALGAASVLALEPDPVLLGAITRGLGPVLALPADPAVRLSADGPLAAARAAPGTFDLVDIAADFLDAGEANAAALTVEALAADLAALRPGGVLSVPVSIRDLPVYGLRVLATLREALRRSGVADPSCCVVIARSAWNLRLLASPDGWTPAQLAAIRRFCDDRSFDLSYYPGIDVAAARAGLYNDLPPVSFDSGEVSTAQGAQDAVADEAQAVLRDEATPSARAFDLSPATLDRPAYYDVLRLARLRTVLARLEVLPQPEVGQLVNLAVLAQAAVIAALVLALPLLAGARIRGRRGAGQGAAPVGMVRAALTFALLGLGFLFLELFLIEKASLYLDDRTSAFALVLTGMLVCSGAGSLAAERIGLRLAGAIVLGWCALAGLALQPALLATLGLPWAVRAGLVLAVLAPVSVTLGVPFPLGLSRLAVAGPDARQGAAQGGLLPWAWALNGAFSVVATPLASLVATQLGLRAVLLGAALLYGAALTAFPTARRSLVWQDIPIS